MMYGNKLAIAIKANGRVLREFGDKVYVPFGTEYTMLIKNLHTTRVVVNVYIDGTNATEGSLVIEAGREVELERFIKTDLAKGNRFKFIERSAGIEKHRGIKREDGLVVVNYQFEAMVPVFTYTNHYMPRSIAPATILYKSSTLEAGGLNGRYTSRGTIATKTLTAYDSETTMGSGDLLGSSTNCSAVMDSSLSSITRAIPAQSENGITVPGSISEQKFTETRLGAMDPAKYSMVIKLLGETDDNKPVSRPLTVHQKPTCITCGRKNKATSKFCNACGTGLVLAV